MFEQYGKLAEMAVPSTVQNGRYLSQQDAELLIPADIVYKLMINESDNLLDIGCGSGTIANALSDFAGSVTGCDHKMVVENLSDTYRKENLSFCGADFFEFSPDEQFNKVILYGVIQTLPDYETVETFVDKAISHMRSDGRLLIGDIPNQDKKRRFLNSDYGKRFQKAWEKQQSDSEPNPDLEFFYNHGSKVVDFTDDVLMKLLIHIRSIGHHAYVVDQPQKLPFGNTREDILVVGANFEQKS